MDPNFQRNILLETFIAAAGLQFGERLSQTGLTMPREALSCPKCGKKSEFLGFLSLGIWGISWISNQKTEIFFGGNFGLDFMISLFAFCWRGIFCGHHFYE